MKNAHRIFSLDAVCGSAVTTLPRKEKIAAFEILNHDVIVKFSHAIRAQLLLFFACGILQAETSTNSTGNLMVSFMSGDKMLLGYLYRPAGQGPFPGVIFHHGFHKSLMEYEAEQWQPMAELFASHGYIFFLPDRHPDSMKKEEYSLDLQGKLRAASTRPTISTNSAVRNQQLIEKEEIIQRDVRAALRWFVRQPDVDTNRIAVTGQYAGAVHALYEAEKLSEVRAIVAMGPAVTSWETDLVIRGLLVGSIKKCKQPILLIYTENQNQEPAEVLGEILKEKGGLSRTKIYPTAGEITNNGKNFIHDGTNIWGSDTIEFLKKAMK